MKRAIAILAFVLVIPLASVTVATWVPLPPEATALTFHSLLADQGPAPTLLPGATATYTVRFRNIGVSPWQRGGRTQVNLGVRGDSLKFAELGMNVGWLSANRVATTAEELVPPGGIGTFTFTVRAPATPGIYQIPLRPVADGITWLEDDGVMSLITVSTDKLTPRVPAAPAAPAETSVKLGPSVASLTLSATVEQATLAIGGTQKINASFASASATSGLFLGIEVFGPGGTVIAYQKWFQNESFAAGEQRTYSVSWQIPRGVATGGYTVATIAYSAGWRNSRGSEPTAATFNVTPADGSAGGPPVPPATVSPTPAPGTPAPTSSPALTSPPAPSGTAPGTAAPTPTVPPTSSASAVPTPTIAPTGSPSATA